MSIMRHAPVPTSSELQAEAAAVERLRRQIAEMPSKGESVSPQMLADFARAQKAYLDRKIEFEKLKRTETGALKLPSAVREAPVAPVAPEPGIPVPAKFAAPLPKVAPPVAAENSPEAPQVAKVPVPPLSTAKPAKSPMIWVIGAVIVVVLGIVALLVLR